MTEEAAPGYSAPIYQSQLQPLTFALNVPYQLAVGMLVVVALLIVAAVICWPYLIWRFALVGAGCYLGVALLVSDDHRFFAILLRYLSYPSVLE